MGISLLASKNFPDLADPRFIDHRSPILQRFDSYLNPLSDFIELPFRSREDGELVAAAAIEGNYALITASQDQADDPLGCPACSQGVFLSLASTEGASLERRLQVNTVTAGIERPSRNGIAADGLGQLVVAYTRLWPNRPTSTDVWVRRFHANGAAAGPELQVNQFDLDDQLAPTVAAAPDGSFLVAWQSFGQDGSNDGIFARLFGAEGTARSDEFRVNVRTASGQRAPAVAVDSAGNFAIAWQDFETIDSVTGWEVKVRLFRSDGTPVAGETLVNQEHRFEQVQPQLAFAPNGTLLMTWSNSATDDIFIDTDIRSRFYAASPGPEPCGVAGAAVLCDTGRTGGAPELRLSWAGRPGEVTLLGDWDGDGRHDLCAWLRGRFRCDLDHEGAPAEVRRVFGRLGDVPLLGDLDGDGRAELCVRRGRRLLCDTAHDGGGAETVFALGTAQGLPLLGDLDGDGRDDLCLFEDGLWTCTTGHGPAVRIGYGTPGDLPTLGDLDRDGKADPCLLRAGRLLCDVLHNGGIGEGVLDLNLPAGSTPLFGNLDGL